MFFRTKKSGSRSYLQIVENRWENGRARQRVVTTLGRLDQLQESGQLDALLASGFGWLIPLNPARACPTESPPPTSTSAAQSCSSVELMHGSIARAKGWVSTSRYHECKSISYRSIPG